jgi:hypothetical protein
VWVATAVKEAVIITTAVDGNRSRVSFETSFDSKQPKLDSMEPKQTDGQPKQFDMKHILVFFQEI